MHRPAPGARLTGCRLLQRAIVDPRDAPSGGHHLDPVDPCPHWVDARAALLVFHESSLFGGSEIERVLVMVVSAESSPDVDTRRRLVSHADQSHFGGQAGGLNQEGWPRHGSGE